MELKDTLQHYRRERGLSQMELAEALEVSRQTVSKWETGAVLPSAENLLALSQLYGVSTDALLNGVKEDAFPELLPVPAPQAAPPPAPEPERLPRWKLALRILAVVFLFDLLFFFMDISWYSLENHSGFATFSMLARLVTGCAIGLAFAWLDRHSPAGTKTSLLLAAAALAAALYPVLFATPLRWTLYDRIVWGGQRTFEAVYPTSSIRTFIGWTLLDDYAWIAHMLLIASFQLGRLRFSRPGVFAHRKRTVQPTEG